MHWLRCEEVTLVPGHELCSHGTCGCWDKVEGPLSGPFAGTIVEIWDIILPRALNDPNLQPHSGKVMELIRWIQEIQVIASDIMARPGYKDDDFLDREKYREPGPYSRYRDVLWNINHFIGQYEGSLRFPIGAGAFGWDTDFRFKKRTPEEEKKDAKHKQTWERQAIKQVISLAERGLIDRIRQCRKCTLWFFAKAQHQKFCSTECREQDFAKNPKHKETRAKYMRAYRRREKASVTTALIRVRKGLGKANRQ